MAQTRLKKVHVAHWLKCDLRLNFSDLTFTGALKMDLTGGAPSGGFALLRAIDWVAGLLTGSLGSSLASIAVASLGFLMLSGHIDIRRGLQTIFGCFILFGAPVLAKSLLDVGHAASDASVTASQAPVRLKPSQSIKAPRNDPYAGAAMPQ